MKNSTRIRVGRGVSAAADATLIAVGGLALGLHIKEIVDNKAYDPLKDGVRDAASVASIAAGSVGIVNLIRSKKTVDAICSTVDVAEDAGKAVADVIATAVSDDAE